MLTGYSQSAHQSVYTFTKLGCRVASSSARAGCAQKTALPSLYLENGQNNYSDNDTRAGCTHCLQSTCPSTPSPGWHPPLIPPKNLGHFQLHQERITFRCATRDPEATTVWALSGQGSVREFWNIHFTGGVHPRP